MGANKTAFAYFRFETGHLKFAGLQWEIAGLFFNTLILAISINICHYFCIIPGILPSWTLVNNPVALPVAVCLMTGAKIPHQAKHSRPNLCEVFVIAWKSYIRSQYNQSNNLFLS